MATRDQVKTKCQRQADMENSNFVGSTEWDDLIALAYREAWDIIVAAGEDYFVKNVLFTISSGNTYAIVATDFYKLRGVLKKNTAGKYRPIKRYDLEEVGTVEGPAYMLQESTITFEPEDNAVGDYKYFYVYKPADPAGGDTIVDVNGWVEQYIIDATVNRALAKEESDASQIRDLQLRLETRIRRMAKNRDAGKPKTVADTRQSRGFSFRTRSGYGW